MQQRKKILAIPGSLRSDSSSYVVLNIVREMIPDEIAFEIFEGIGDLPHFNDPKETPVSVVNFKSKLKEAGGIVVCTPEYAFGVPGSLKNALDWTVGSGEFYQKPVALITASSYGEKGHQALLNIFTAIAADVPDNRQLLMSFIRARLEDGKFKDSKDYEKTRDVIDSLVGVLG